MPSEKILIAAVSPFERKEELAAAVACGLRAFDVGATVSLRVGRSRTRRERFRTAFPGYLFLAPYGPAIAHLSRRGKRAQIILEHRFCYREELEACQRLLDDSEPGEEVVPSVGDRARIIAGPMCGIIGVIERIDRERYATIIVGGIQRVKIPLPFLSGSGEKVHVASQRPRLRQRENAAN